MNKKVIKILEFNKIVETLSSFAVSGEAAELCRNLRPINTPSEIERMQTETADALALVFKKDVPSFSGIHDVSMHLSKARIGGCLAAADLLQIASLLMVAKRCKEYFNEEAHEVIKEDSPLEELFTFLDPVKPLQERISKIIITEDEIADDASSTLFSIRKEKAAAEAKIRNLMNSYVADGALSELLQERVVTTRGGRFCLPVKAENKTKVPGMIHDQSATGSTLFIEPLEVVNLNNTLRELELQEKEEIRIILEGLTASVKENDNAIGTDYECLLKLDFIFARALYAKEIGGMRPIFNKKGIVDLKKARHPMLDPETAVPVSLTIGKDFDLLLITGPNTGGKTVSLKTVGLLALMAQAGLHIPAGDGSSLPVFDEVYADIGDEQSIEASLSTFSSHMKNITYILGHANSHSLVLMDELCAGTDPQQGAALATAILDDLHKRGVRTMATTHYSELKQYALTTEGVENGSFAFSLETMSPTYKLQIGVPGKSNAFEISRKYGLSDAVIEDAKSRLNNEAEDFENLITSLEENHRIAEEARFEAERLRDTLKEREAKVREREERINEQREKVINKANQQAASILKEAKSVADEAIKNFNKFGTTNPSIQELEGERSKLSSKIKKAQGKNVKEAPTPINMHVPKKLVVGDRVKVLSMNNEGTVHTLPDDKGNLEVQMGILKMRVNIQDLVLLDDEGKVVTNVKKKKQVNTSSGSFGKAMSISTEVMLIGMNSDEAIMTLDKYLDDAYIVKLVQVRVVHGKGSGILRKAVHEFLRKDKRVAEYRLGVFGEGDAGVTIVTFK